MKYLLFFLLLTVKTFAQQLFVVKDLETNEPIGYTGIYALDGSLKINAEGNGSFTIPADFLDKTFVFDAVGYEAKQQQLTDVIYLQPKSEILGELVIIPKLETKEAKIGSVKKSESKIGFGTGELQNPWSFGRYFPLEKKIEDTPFLKEIAVLFHRAEIETTYAVKIYEADENGFPKELLHDSLIVGTLKKKKSLSKIDLTPYQIRMEKNGIVVVFEWLTIQSNYYEKVWYDGNIRKISKFYSPTVLATTTGEKKQSLLKHSQITNGNWKNSSPYFIEENIGKGMYPLIMCEITLTN